LATNKLHYRVRLSGDDWLWEVCSDSNSVLASGTAENCVAARVAALRFGLDEMAEDPLPNR
jgi:hypothetical protein